MDNMKEVAIGPKGRIIPWNNDLEVAFNYINKMVSSKNLINYTYWAIPIKVKLIPMVTGSGYYNPKQRTNHIFLEDIKQEKNN